MYTYLPFMLLPHNIRSKGKRQHLWIKLGVVQAVELPNQYPISDTELLPLAPVFLYCWTVTHGGHSLLASIHALIGPISESVF